jgi:hypothetical protein
VCGADDLIVLPTLPVAVFPAPVLVGENAVPVGKLADSLLEEHQPIEEMGHRPLPLRDPAFVALRDD